jgi:hypothetical protein
VGPRPDSDPLFQLCELNSQGEVRWGAAGDLCFDGRGERITLAPCPSHQPTQGQLQWRFLKVGGGVTRASYSQKAFTIHSHYLKTLRICPYLQNAHIFCLLGFSTICTFFFRFGLLLMSWDYKSFPHLGLIKCRGLCFQLIITLSERLESNPIYHSCLKLTYSGSILTHMEHKVH